MTTAIPAVITDISPSGDKSAMQALWTLVTESNTLGPVYMPAYTARSISFEGTFGGATAVINGSNDGTNYSGLNNLQGSAVSKTSAAIVQIQESTIYYQPAISGGSSQSMTVTMLFVGPRRY